MDKGMHMLNEIIENSIISGIASSYKRSPLQVNKIHESDSEIIKLNQDLYLAITTDCISEEIETGLYDDPWLIGWMAVTVNLSDISAVGAKPVGLVISQIIPDNTDNVFIKRLSEGISDACEEYGTYVLGGDLNSGNQLIITGTATGIIDNGNIITRKGIKEGDILFISGRAGLGNAYALNKFSNMPGVTINYQPKARIKEGMLLREYASACMDTSDGVISTIDQLSRINNTGFAFNEYENLLDPEAIKVSEYYNFPFWLFLAGQHGEFELIFSIPRERTGDFIKKAGEINWHPIELGNATKNCAITIPLYNKTAKLDSGYIRNLYNSVNSDKSRYIEKLLQLDQQLR
jgi:thiamine-monophosphate kinase